MSLAESSDEHEAFYQRRRDAAGWYSLELASYILTSCEMFDPYGNTARAALFYEHTTRTSTSIDQAELQRFTREFVSSLVHPDARSGLAAARMFVSEPYGLTRYDNASKISDTVLQSRVPGTESPLNFQIIRRHYADDRTPVVSAIYLLNNQEYERMQRDRVVKASGRIATCPPNAKPTAQLDSRQINGITSGVQVDFAADGLVVLPTNDE